MTRLDGFQIGLNYVQMIHDFLKWILELYNLSLIGNRCILYQFRRTKVEHVLYMYYPIGNMQIFYTFLMKTNIARTINTIGATSEAETTCHSGAHEFIPSFL